MDQKERSADSTAALKTALSGWQRGIWTALPGIIIDFNPADCTATVQPAINAVILKQDPKTGAQTQANTTLPVLPKVPVVFPGGGGFGLTFPIAKGDEVLVVFASRCIDAWWQSGGTQGQIEQRAHDLSDGIAIAGLRSVPRVPGSISASSVQLRSDDGSTHVEIAAGGIVNIVASGGLHVTGNITATGEITAGAGGGDSVTLQQHKHGTGSAAAGTSVPTAGT